MSKSLEKLRISSKPAQREQINVEREKVRIEMAARNAQIAEICCKAGRSDLIANLIIRQTGVEEVRRLLGGAPARRGDQRVAMEGWERAIKAVSGRLR